MKKANTPSADTGSVTCKLTKKPGSQVEVEATASQDLIKSMHPKAVKIIGKNLSVPGFRKGKVPEFFILQKFPQEFQKKWEEVVMREALVSSLDQITVQPLNKEQIAYKVKNFSPETAVFTFTFEVAPEVPTVDPKQFKLTEVKRPIVDEAKVKETIRQTLFFYSTWDKVEGQEIKEGDFVTLNVDLMEVDPPSPIFNGTRFEVADASMAKWMKDLLIGKKVGDVVEGVSEPDEDADQVEKDTLKPQKVRITIQSMEVPKLPEMTPELFKNLGVESEEDLKVKVEQLLNKQADDHVKEENRNQVRDFLLESHPFDLPTELINNEVRFRITQLNQNQEFLQHWQTLDQEGQKKMFEVIRSQSEKAVKLYHLSTKMLEDNKVAPAEPVAPKPIETQLEALISPDGTNYNQAPELRRAEALSKQVLEQAEDYVIAQASSNVVA